MFGNPENSVLLNRKTKKKSGFFWKILKKIFWKFLEKFSGFMFSSGYPENSVIPNGNNEYHHDALKIYGAPKLCTVMY
jgi:hypothetical protein